jgi:PAP2 superfamily
MAVAGREPTRAGGANVVLATHGALRPTWWAELAGLGLGYLAYEWLRAAADHSARVARAHAHDIYQAEQALHLNVEHWCNQVLVSHPWAAAAAGYYYATGHFVVTLMVVVWLYWRHPGPYRPLRSALVVTTLTGLAGYWLYPLAPPRLALAGFTDVVVRHDVLGAASPHGPMGMINLYAAMPSLHVAWAVWVALAISRSAAGPARHLAWCYPVLTTAVVLGTANHYLLDAVAGAAIALLADWAVCHQASAPHQPRPLPANVPSHA